MNRRFVALIGNGLNFLSQLCLRCKPLYCVEIRITAADAVIIAVVMMLWRSQIPLYCVRSCGCGWDFKLWEEHLILLNVNVFIKKSQKIVHVFLFQWK